MQTHPKKRVEVIVEAPLMRRVIDRLDQANVSGYSVMPIIAGRGHDSSWTADGQIGNATQMLAIVCITDASKVDDLLASTFGVISHQIGFITISDVFVGSSGTLLIDEPTLIRVGSCWDQPLPLPAFGGMATRAACGGVSRLTVVR